MRYFFITQDKNLPGSIQYRDFDINGSRHVFSKEDSSQLDSVVALYLAGDGNEARWDFLQHPVTMFSRRFRTGIVLPGGSSNPQGEFPAVPVCTYVNGSAGCGGKSDGILSQRDGKASGFRQQENWTA